VYFSISELRKVSLEREEVATERERTLENLTWIGLYIILKQL